MKILIIKTSSLGDIIHTFPVVEYLKEKNPAHEIDWVVEAPFAELVEAHPFVSRVFRIETRSWRKAKQLQVLWQFVKQLRQTKYDVIFDFQGNMKSAMFNLLSKGKVKAGFGRSSAAEWPNLWTTNFKADPDKNLNVRQENLYLAQQFFRDSIPFQEKGRRLKISSEQEKLIQNVLKDPKISKFKKILVCPGSAWPNKQMTTQTLISFLKKVSDSRSCSFLLVWGNQAEKSIAQEVNNHLNHNSIILEKMSIPTLQNLMDRMDLVIAMDSLPLHLAGTTSTRTFGIFGASSANKYKPNGHRHAAFQGACPYGKTFPRRCPILRTCSTGACIRELEVEELYSDFARIYSKLI